MTEQFNWKQTGGKEFECLWEGHLLQIKHQGSNKYRLYFDGRKILGSAWGVTDAQNKLKAHAMGERTISVIKAEEPKFNGMTLEDIERVSTIVLTEEGDLLGAIREMIQHVRAS